MRPVLSFVAWLLFSPRGRIGRAQWWLAAVICVVLTLPWFAAIVASDIAGFVDENWIAFTIFDAAMIYVAYAIDAKRFQDRDKSHLWSAGASVPFAVWIVVDVAFRLGAMNDSTFDVLDNALLFLTAVISAWLIVELGFLRGTQGSNRYGGDPLAAPLLTRSAMA